MSNLIDLDYHAGQPIVAAGAAEHEAERAVILIHGRGDSAEGILGLASLLPASGTLFVAPQARGNTWYPNSFLAPIEQNEPGISSGLHVIGRIVEDLVERGFERNRILVSGFSQGACLASEFLARAGVGLGGLAILSGGLIGLSEIADAQPPEDKNFDYETDLSGVRVFMGCSDIDPHIPLSRFNQSAEVLGELGALVTRKIYPGMGHTVNQEEIDHFSRLVEDL